MLVYYRLYKNKRGPLIGYLWHCILLLQMEDTTSVADKNDKNVAGSQQDVVAYYNFEVMWNNKPSL
jgi:hypothetical protein